MGQRRIIQNNAQKNIHEIKQTQMQTSNIMNKKWSIQSRFHNAHLTFGKVHTHAITDIRNPISLL
jgi:hypothetical protein